MSEPNGKLISELKVHELRIELINRGIDGNGVKAALVARLEKSLSEQGVDINSYLFATTPDTTITSMENENIEAVSAVPVVPKEEVAETKVKPEDAAQENVKPAETRVGENANNGGNSLTADDLIEKVEDEIDQAELEGHTDDIPVVKKEEQPANGNTNEESPDIGDLEEREESELDEGKNESNSNENEVEIAENGKQQKQNHPIHDISDEEDMGEELIYDDTDEPMEKEEDNKPADVVQAPVAAANDETIKEEDAKNGSKATTPAAAAKSSRIPAGLNFPKDDPHGLRCIWIRGIPIETKLSDLKLAFNDDNFTVQSAKVFTTKQSSRPSAFGFMTMTTEDGAKKAVLKMNNSILKGKIIAVERACDSSMLQTDLLPTAAADRPRVHPPIKPPEDNTKISTTTNESSKPKITAPLAATQKQPRSRDNTQSSQHQSERRRIRVDRSPYMNTINRARIVRAEPPPHHRVVEGSGRGIRVVAARNSMSPPPPRHHHRDDRRYSPVRSSHHRERTPPSHRRHHRSRSPDRLAEETRRKYEEALRKKDEEYRRREKELRLEAERNKDKLEKERLAKENLELKLKLQQEQLRAVAAASSRRSPPRSGSRHRGNTPPQRRSSPPPRRGASPSRRLSPRRSPPRSSRHASPPRQQHHSSSRRSAERHEPRHHAPAPPLPSYRQEPPKEAYPSRRSRSPIRSTYDRSNSSRDQQQVEFSRGRGRDLATSNKRPPSPIRNPPPAKYERHSPRRNYENPRDSRSDRSRRDDKPDPASYRPVDDHSRSSRSARNGRDFPDASSRTFEEPRSGGGGGSNSYSSSSRRETSGSNHFQPPSNNPPATYNFSSGSVPDYHAPLNNPSYSTPSNNSRNPIPNTNTTWAPPPNYISTNQPPPQTWNQPQTIPSLSQWNPTTFGGQMRNTNQRYGGF